jgi:ribosomal-protein-alanine N-acetyltransferase
MSVEVRRVRRADAAELIAANREGVGYHAPWITAFIDQAGFDAWFARGITGANVSLVARERAGGELVGVINVSEIVMGVFRSAYLGYWGYARTGGRGLMTQALREAVRFAFDELDLHRVEANVQPGNVRSIALVRRAGFSREGFSPGYLFIDGAWRDHERWALLRGAAPSA